MDKRRKHIDSDAERELRNAFESDIANQRLSIPSAIKAMRRLSQLTQPEFAKHRGISLATLKQLESGAGQPKVSTLNKVADIFGLEVAFVRKANRQEAPPVGVSRLSVLATAYANGAVTWRQIRSELRSIGFGDLLVELGKQNLSLPTVISSKTSAQAALLERILDDAQSAAGRK